MQFSSVSITKLSVVKSSEEKFQVSFSANLTLERPWAM